MMNKEKNNFNNLPAKEKKLTKRKEKGKPGKGKKTRT